jgi:hypothetical protein
MLSAAGRKSLLSLNEAVSHANHTTGIVKQYPDISTGKAGECGYSGILPLQKAGAVTVGALKSRRPKNCRRIGDCRYSRLEFVNPVGVEFVAYRRTRRNCEDQANDE